MKETVTYRGRDANALAADIRGEENRLPVLLLHGGGQTRHAWDETARHLAEAGWTAITLDQRGHGESEWVADGAYTFDSFARDLLAVAEQLADDYDRLPVCVGASLGGIAALLAHGEVTEPFLSALVLVDIVPRMNPQGVEKILGFMSERLEEGFASIEEAADAIAAYLPHRERPDDLSGLAKNLKLSPDGRYRWHWDPRFIAGPCSVAKGHHKEMETRVHDAAGRLSIPVLLVRGRQSELVSEEVAREFLADIPQAEYADVSEAGHMVAGDRNDAFTQAVLGFLGRLSK